MSQGVFPLVSKLAKSPHTTPLNVNPSSSSEYLLPVGYAHPLSIEWSHAPKRKEPDAPYVAVKRISPIRALKDVLDPLDFLDNPHPLRQHHE